jgi:hypothetical protein
MGRGSAPRLAHRPRITHDKSGRRVGRQHPIEHRSNILWEAGGAPTQNLYSKQGRLAAEGAMDFGKRPALTDGDRIYEKLSFASGKTTLQFSAMELLGRDHACPAQPRDRQRYREADHASADFALACSRSIIGRSGESLARQNFGPFPDRSFVADWEELLRLPTWELRALLTSRNQDMKRLRLSSPFVTAEGVDFGDQTLRRRIRRAAKRIVARASRRAEGHSQGIRPMAA